jgi:hypothetical protein
MMALLVGELANLIDHRQGGAEVGELERPGQMMLVDGVPVGYLLAIRFQFFAAQGRGALAAWGAFQVA